MAVERFQPSTKPEARASVRKPAAFITNAMFSETMQWS